MSNCINVPLKIRSKKNLKKMKFKKYCHGEWNKKDEFTIAMQGLRKSKNLCKIFAEIFADEILDHLGFIYFYRNIA